MHPAELAADDLLAECRMTTTRRSGPGGQHRNKVETAVVIEHLPTGLRAEAGERRSQADNRRVALWRLRLRLALEHRIQRDGVKPSDRWRKRVQDGRICVSASHEDYPALLAEAFDWLTTSGGDLRPLTRHFDVTATQLANLFRREPAAWQRLNALRAEHGRPPLK
jgi:hypothetical protein